MNIIQIRVGDIIEMKKKHSCGSCLFRVMRTGSDIRIICCSCGRDITVPREKLEKSIKKTTTGTDAGQTASGR